VATPASTVVAVSDNLRLLFSLYRRPARTMGRILDEGSLLFGAAAVLVVGLVLSLGMFLPVWATIQAQTDGPRESSADSSPSTSAPAEPNPFGDGVTDAEGGPPGGGTWMAQAFFGSMVSSVFFALLGLAFLYIPACVLAATLLAPVGSFGVAFRRDYGSLLACALFSWTAAHLPFALLSLALPGLSFPLRFLLVLSGLAVFAVFMVLAVRTVFGVGAAVGLGVTILGSLGLLLAPLGPFLASPFLLYIGWQYFRGDLADVQSIFGRRQSFKRHLHAATLNPRDAEAHYQLGLIHQQRRESDEAKARFLKAIEIDPREIDAHYQLGRLAREAGRFEDAIGHFEEVVRRDEAHARHELWREIGATYFASTSWPNARWALEKFAVKRPHDPEGLLLLGQVLAALQEKALAEDAFRRCIESVDTMPTFRRAEVARFKKQARKLLSTL
jgi:tetratricopeptide (TPR) repeat protein